MFNNKVEMPCIKVIVNKANDDLLKEILAGIEEEGIPYKVTTEEINLDNLVSKTYNASCESRMGIAIGIYDLKVVLHFNKMKELKPIICKKIDNSFIEFGRIIGCNAARLYKVMPFKTEDDIKKIQNIENNHKKTSSNNETNNDILENDHISHSNKKEKLNEETIKQIESKVRDILNKLAKEGIIDE